jgi:O-antigen ligase
MGWSATGATALYVFAVSARVSTTLAILALAVMLLAFAFAARVHWRALRGDALAWLAAAAIVYLAAHALWTARTGAAVAARPGDALALAQLWLFVVAASWMRAQPQRAFGVLALALIGFAFGLAMRACHDDVLTLLFGLRDRELFGLPTIACALYAGTALLGLIVFAPRLWGAPGTRLRSLRVIAWVLGLAFLTQTVVMAQSRGTWLACAVAFTPVVWIGARAWLRSLPPPRLRAGAPAIAGLLAVAVLLAADAGVIAQRIATDSGTLAAIGQGDRDAVPTHRHSSYGLRFHLHELGVRRWLERPWLGWGPGATPALIEEHDRATLRGHAHLHNSYLELLLRLGVVGLVMFVAAPVIVARRVVRAARRRAVPGDLALFLLGALGLLAVWSLFDFRMTNADWRFYWIIVMGTAAGMGWGRVERGKD